MGAEYSLPYGVGLENVWALLDDVRKNPGRQEADHKVRAKEYNRSKSVLIEWGLMTSVDTQLRTTESGAEISWASPENRRAMVLKHVAASYPPYEIALERFSKQGVSIAETDDLQRIWAQDLGIELSAENLSRAAATFFAVLNDAGVGRYVIGRQGKKTRVEFADGAFARVRATLDGKATSGVGSLDSDESSVLLPAETVQRPVTSWSTQSATDEVPTAPPAPGASHDWSEFNTDFFQLRIKKSASAWRLLKAVLPAYEVAIRDTTDAETSPVTIAPVDGKPDSERIINDVVGE